MKIIDVNVAAGFWPIQRFTDRSLPELDRTLEHLGISQAWTSAIESILFPEPDSHDAAMCERIREFPRFRPVKTINPLLANWHKSLSAALSRCPIAAAKVFPNYHGYPLASDAMRQLCEVLRQHDLPLLIQMRVNDERNQPPFLQVKGVSATDIAQLAADNPDNLIIALCAYNIEVADLCKGGDNLLVDLSFLDESESLDRRFDGIMPMDRFVFGSHAPFLHARAAHMKLTHFQLPENLRTKVASENLTARLERTLCERLSSHSWRS